MTSQSIRILNKILVAIIIIELSYFAVTQIISNKSLMNTISLATTVKPETFTELYFQNHIELPKIVEPKKKYSFEFTIHNMENKDIEYPYEIYINEDGKKAYLDKNAIKLSNAEKVTIQQSFILEHPISRAKVTVILTNKNQQIAFWIGEDNK